MMLRLTEATSSAWVKQALDNVEDLLIDHAHCEKKAASTAINLIFRYPNESILLKPLSELAREELEHFELVLDNITQRGWTYRRFKPSAYAGKLMSEVRKAEPFKMLDTLLCCALIEARSCERMKLLADAFVDHDDGLAHLYKSLLASEARHHSLYIDLAHHLFDKDEVKVRLQFLSEHESKILADPQDELRMHS
jgi:tRNA 2-(methylsulfanyl)-N6-isopentenyladenosine37 hydroxylase